MKVSILIALACSISSAFGAGPLDAVTNIVGGVLGGGAGGSPLDAVTSLAKGGVAPLDSMTGIMKGVGLDEVTGILKGGSKGDTGSISSAFDKRMIVLDLWMQSLTLLEVS
ncbi:uncharacterized protein LOC129566973 [Sitodiplosis mosellana]|uniref:uncharacterized protein LOC129566973 n=1 Tax=Sitodiplosis mosellana TaxID=263140 RepID=UPI0024441E9A|nr:uncharacterized protein LOC129566973 [Sitodiplosis mosellana]